MEGDKNMGELDDDRPMVELKARRIGTRCVKWDVVRRLEISLQQKVVRETVITRLREIGYRPSASHAVP